MVRYSGSHSLLNLFPQILKSWAKEAYRFRISFNLSFIWKKLHHKCFWHSQQRMGVLSATKSHFHPRLHKPISKVLPMYRYKIVATIYFSVKNFSQTISCFRNGFHRYQKFKYVLQMQLWQLTFSTIYLNQKNSHLFLKKALLQYFK